MDRSGEPLLTIVELEFHNFSEVNNTDGGRFVAARESAQDAAGQLQYASFLECLTSGSVNLVPPIFIICSDKTNGAARVAECQYAGCLDFDRAVTLGHIAHLLHRTVPQYPLVARETLASQFQMRAA
jgi:hypothetical protein